MFGGKLKTEKQLLQICIIFIDVYFKVYVNKAQESNILLLEISLMSYLILKLFTNNLAMCCLH